MAELVLCGHASPFDRFEACPKEKDHEGEHVYWAQTQPHRKRGRNGVWLVDEGGHTIVHATFDGPASAEDVCALLALQEAVAAARKERDA